jgi:hypothetical protein
MGKTAYVRIDPAGNVSIPQVLPPAGAISLFNGNTFAEIGRALANALFSDLAFHRRKETSSAVAHFITGVLDEDMMIEVIDTLSETSDWKTGDRVKTLRGSLHGKILRVLNDGRIVWQPDGTTSELTALPESLCAEKRRR